MCLIIYIIYFAVYIRQLEDGVDGDAKMQEGKCVSNNFMEGCGSVSFPIDIVTTGFVMFRGKYVSNFEFS
jgi:hypothetical protein